MSKVTVAVALVALAMVLQSTSALKCWSCNSQYNPACEYLLNATQHTRDTYLKDCNSQQSQNTFSISDRQVCKKRVWSQNGKTIIDRSCSSPTPEERDITDGSCKSTAADQQNVYGSLVSCHICSKDECNSASSIVGSRVFQIVSIFLAITPFIRSLIL